MQTAPWNYCFPNSMPNYPDIEVEIISLGIDDHHTSIVNSIAAGAPCRTL